VGPTKGMSRTDKEQGISLGTSSTDKTEKAMHDVPTVLGSYEGTQMDSVMWDMTPLCSPIKGGPDLTRMLS
jgi:hypothetical protein